MSEQDVLAAVRALAPAVRARAHEAEALCRVPDATIKELATVGLFRLVQPRLHGGLAADPAVFLDCIRELARACGSTGWVIGVFGCNTWQLSLYDPRAQEDVWGVDRDARICSSIAPVGQVARVEGGYRLNGRWGFSSGSDHADWVMLGGMVRDDDGKPVEMRHFLLPRTDYAVDRVWDTVGLRGTGSNDVVVENAFVPAHRTIGAEQIASRIRPGHAVNPEPLYRLPMGSVFTSTISTPIVGMAEAAYQGYLDATRDRIKVAGMSRAAEDPFTQARVGRAASDIDAAWLQLVRNISDLYDCAKRGEDPPMGLRTRLRRDQVLATERSVAAVDLLVESAGGGAMRTGDNVLQRAWRDVHNGRGHVANDPERALVLFGRNEFGFDVSDLML
ncbi:3-hydroxy-9,10-secoandrosta-1,3,5(10)-triene-9,17-dione monooxygenase oxygenase subunit [Umezawaea tangerina]|uniref:3-hydroxy-9,10-secoandrosta-1,3,5(10)-triene-9, 17-dione monooxygenase n=1 Tax=Umezawaea tangerina TaxID=84725 RepID=A0A2T0TH29_9PSEU|nr:3-hydroxy-9,10-secoandrosta-1,3,5(10)-triene-9,17-dione monooxygenase oxygenase subunit [Umezawaea tangerina]PRY44921.1 3-hydroxy-9,10-secoandrosta-1,3,5(10)-triene-9,17-dione monooxygenase [Umezawaea tangerina]